MKASLLALALFVTAPPALAQMLGGPGDPPAVDWVQRLGAQVDLSASFVDASGRETTIGDTLGERPVILALVYYECPMLCDLVLNGLVRSLRPLRLEPGRDFDIVAVGIDPGETPELARAKRDGYVELYGRDGGAAGWHFLSGKEAAIDSVAEAVGYEYSYIPETDEYAHAAGIVLLTPSGRVSHYFYGTEFSSRDLQFGLIEAADGKLGSPVQKVLLRCFQYDPARGKYGLAILGTIRVAGMLTLGILLTFVVRSLLRDRRRSPLTPAVAEKV